MTAAAAVSTPTPERTRSLVWWLAPTGLLAVIAIGVLWAIPRPAQACILIYPAPEECATGGDPTTVIAFLVLIVAIYAAIVTCALLIPARLRPLVLGLLSGALGLVILIGLAATLADSAGPVYYY
jgi:hypothetical protein